EQLGGLRKVDQDIGLRRAASARLSALLGHRLVERRHPASGLLQLRPQRLERGTVVPPERCEPFQYLRRERGAGIGGGPLDEIVERVANLLGRVNGSADGVATVGNIGRAHRAPSWSRATPAF